MSEERLVFLHGINMERYCGYEENLHGGAFGFVRKHGFGYEILNFADIGGRCYGYVELTPIDDKPRSIDLTNLGGSKTATSLDGVLAVWTAPCRQSKGREIVGWYRNATLHKRLIEPAGRVKGRRTCRHPLTGEELVLGYRIEANVEDCFLLRPEQRKLRIPAYPKRTKGVPGQTAVYYPYRHSSKEAKKLRSRVLDFVNDSGTKSSQPAAPKKARRPRKAGSGAKEGNRKSCGGACPRLFREDGKRAGIQHRKS